MKPFPGWSPRFIWSHKNLCKHKRNCRSYKLEENCQTACSRWVVIWDATFVLKDMNITLLLKHDIRHQCSRASTLSNMWRLASTAQRDEYLYKKDKQEFLKRYRLLLCSMLQFVVIEKKDVLQ